MIRKSLFWGLTLVLVVALVNLMIRGRRLEKQQGSQPVEVVQESTPTSTRVLAPQDLEILHSGMRLEEQAGSTAQAETAVHEIEIRNNGSVPYGTIQLGFDYLGSDGKLLASKTRSIIQTIVPGATLKLIDLKAEGLPTSTASSRVAVIFADIGKERRAR